MNTSTTLVIIPARYASTRFPGKPLAMIAGKSMIQRVYEQVKSASLVAKVVVATDDKRIFNHVESFGGAVMMTDSKHRSGTDRCAEVAAKFPDFEYFINVQGDEPFIHPNQVNQVIQILQTNPKANIATLVKKIEDQSEVFNPNIVKAVFNKQNEALYFSRNPIPFQRGIDTENWLKSGDYYRHIGIYGFRQNTLLEVAGLAPTSLEKAESLEQLRWLENGYTIGIDLTNFEAIGIDTPEDLERLEL